MPALALVTALLMANPSSTSGTDVPRRSGLQVEGGLGAATWAAPGDFGWHAATGFAIRSQFSVRFLLGDHLRLGPMLASSLALAQVASVVRRRPSLRWGR